MKKCSVVPGSAVILEHAEGRPALGIERYDLAVDDGVIGHIRQRLHDAGVAGVEIVVFRERRWILPPVLMARAR